MKRMLLPLLAALSLTLALTACTSAGAPGAGMIDRDPARDFFIG